MTLKSKTPNSNGIGDLFGGYGKEHIKTFKPSHYQIKLMQAIRVCERPALGGSVFICKECIYTYILFKNDFTWGSIPF